MKPTPFSLFRQLLGLAIVLSFGLTSCASSSNDNDLKNKELDDMLGIESHDEDTFETRALADKLEKRNKDYRDYQQRLEMRDKARWERRFPQN